MISEAECGQDIVVLGGILKVDVVISIDCRRRCSIEGSPLVSVLKWSTTGTSAFPITVPRATHSKGAPSLAPSTCTGTTAHCPGGSRSDCTSLMEIVGITAPASGELTDGSPSVGAAVAFFFLC